MTKPKRTKAKKYLEATTRKEPLRRGPKDKEYDEKLFQNLCHVQCTVDEIEFILSTDQRTIDKWCKRKYNENFSTIYKRFSMGGKASLRRYQFNLAKTNASMAIWLGKQWLGQKDEPTMKEVFDGELGKILDFIKETKRMEGQRAA